MHIRNTPRVFRYKKKYLKSDIFAALVVTAIAIPESLGFAAIVGLPPVTGLYSALLAPIIFALFASTKRLIIGADSATAALIASGAILVAQSGSAHYASAVGMLALLSACFLLLMAVFRLGFLADLISRPVLVGFLGGVGINLMITRLPSLIGIEGSGMMWEHVHQTLRGIPHMNGMTVTVSILVIGIVVLFRRSRVPGQLIGLLLAGILTAMFNLSSYGVVMVGKLPDGLPGVALPLVSFSDMVMLVPVALAIAMVIVAQSSSVIRILSNEHDDEIRMNKDIGALGAANIAAALTHGFSVNGSPPRSLAADAAGGKTRFVGVLMAIFIGVLLMGGGNLFIYVPTAALSAIIFLIGLQLIRFRELAYLWDRHRSEFMVAMTALLATAALGVRYGVFIAVIVSLMERLSRQYRPKDEILLRDGVLSTWAKERIDPNKQQDTRHDGLLIYSFESSLFFENVPYFRERILGAIKDAHQSVRYVIIDAGAMEGVDYTAVETIKQLFRQLAADGIQIGFAHVSPHLFDQFEDYGLIDIIGKKHVHSTLNEAVTAHPVKRRSVYDFVKKLKLNDEDYVVVGGAVMEALNLRETKDIDIVVADTTYKKLKDSEEWQESILSNGERILSHYGYEVMKTWMGYDIDKLRRSSFVKNGIHLMGVTQLIDAKKQLARDKDIEDAALLKSYLKHKK
jgi:MFS superfamily sulfate permease-like transporter